MEHLVQLRRKESLLYEQKMSLKFQRDQSNTPDPVSKFHWLKTRGNELAQRQIICQRFKALFDHMTV